MNKDIHLIYDVAIIGGGIAGAGIARDAALRGLMVVLFEKNTFGSGTSSKSSKLIHGGIRYLETAWTDLIKGHLSEAWKNLCFVFISLRESKRLCKIAPQLVKPLPLFIPVIANGGRSLWEVFLGSWLYFFLSLLSGQAKPPRILWNSREVQKLIPSLDSQKIKAGVILWDHLTDDEALVKQTMRSAAQHGAVAFEHAEVKNYGWEADKSSYKIRVRKNETTAEDYYSKSLVDASGPWVDRTRALANERTEDLIAPIAGAHIVFKQFIPHSVILQAADGRPFFVVNTGGFSRVGTTERLCPDPDTVTVTEEEVDYLLRSLGEYFPSLDLNRSKIVGRDAGVRPLARPKYEKTAHTISRDHEIRVGPTGVLHVLGVKLTDHRRTAEKVVNKLTNKKCLTRVMPLEELTS